MKRLFLTLAAVAVAWSVGSVPAKASSSFPGIANGNAYAAFVTLNSTLPAKVIAGPIAPVSLYCNVLMSSNANRVLAVSLGSALVSGTATDTVASTHSTSGATMQSTSTVQGLSALNGFVRASAVHAVANSMGSGAGVSSNANGSSFVNLIIAGLPVSANAAPNTTLALPGIGSVVLNEQIRVQNAAYTSIQVNMIHIRVTLPNALGLKTGTNIIVAHAQSSITRVLNPVSVSADAYGLFAQGYAGNLSATSGPFAPASIGCTAGNNTVQVLGVMSPIGTTGVVTDNAQGSVTTSSSAAQGKSDIANVNVLNHLVVADAIESLSSVNSSGTRFGATTLVNAKIAGIAIAANPAPNTRINLANLGYVILNQQSGSTSATSAAEQVIAIHIYVTLANSFNLPIGSNIIIAHSHAAIIAF